MYRIIVKVIVLAQSIFNGDSEADIETGKMAGAEKTIHYLGALCIIF